MDQLIEAAKKAIDAIADAPNVSSDERRQALNDVGSQLDTCLEALEGE